MFIASKLLAFATQRLAWAAMPTAHEWVRLLEYRVAGRA